LSFLSVSAQSSKNTIACKREREWKSLLTYQLWKLTNPTCIFDLRELSVSASVTFLETMSVCATETDERERHALVNPFKIYLTSIKFFLILASNLP